MVICPDENLGFKDFIFETAQEVRYLLALGISSIPSLIYSWQPVYL